MNDSRIPKKNPLGEEIQKKRLLDPKIETDIHKKVAPSEPVVYVKQFQEKEKKVTGEMLFHNYVSHGDSNVAHLVRGIRDAKQQNELLESRVNQLEDNFHEDLLDPKERIYIHNSSFEQAVETTLDTGSVFQKEGVRKSIEPLIDTHTPEEERLINEARTQTIEEIYSVVTLSGAVFATIATIISVIVNSVALIIIFALSAAFLFYAYYTGPES
ncbi:hypothetical protein EGH24_07915 [Halonotius terrestris]|uniref:Uncharacterized protein n=1 Tax=Halonotius terrestris TaxID=2487750 RepID=A0A8J8PBJ8_9EURY|nr:hypothetical protein [Halonotius terrestris]TQQ81063.1 hypothetical protein EGH24_07915 [Halonotius terrestris]